MSLYTDLVIDPVSMFGNTFARRFLFSAECEIFSIISHFNTDFREDLNAAVVTRIAVENRVLLSQPLPDRSRNV